MVNKKHLYYLAFISIITMTLFSCSSFLYDINPWSDANIFLTIGKGMINGKIPYVDLFDHKGPILYLVYAIAALISDTSFLGVYVIEIICMVFYLYYSYKIYSLYNQENNDIHLYLIFMAVVLTTSKAFSYGGGSVEELLLPLLQCCMYQTLKTVKNNQSFNIATCVFFGITTSVSFLMKYTICGFFLGLFVYCILYQVKNNKQKILSCIISATLGFLLPIVFISVYFLCIGEFNAYINGYFITNISGYATWKSPVIVIFELVKGILWYLKNNILLVGASLLGLLFTWKNKELFKCCIITFGFWYVLNFIGGIYIHYYVLPISIYMIYAYSMVKNIKYHQLALVTLGCLSVLFSHNIYLLNEPTIQETIVDTMMEYTEDPSFIVYHGYDEGFYLQADTIPACRYFTVINAENQNYDEDTLNCITDNDFDFLISMNEKVDVEGYELINVFKDDYDYKEREYNLYKNEYKFN